MKIRIQGNKIIMYAKDKNGCTCSETYFFTRYGVSNLMRRVSEFGRFDFDDVTSFDNFERISDLWKKRKLT